MDDKKGWPTLPNYKDFTVPRIPEEFTLFGIKFLVKDNIPQPEEEYEDLDIPRLKSLINESIGSFKRLLKTSDRQYFERIKAIHLEMNNMINKGKLWETKILLQKLKNQKIEWRKEKIESVNKLF